MRVKTRRVLIQLSLFGCVLLFVLVANRPSFANRSFKWTTIRYKSSTSSSSLPTARGICPGLLESSKPALVVARVTADGDAKWLDSLEHLYHICVYTSDAPADPDSVYLQVPANRGHESMPYLSFITDNYDQIPTAGAVFVHGNRWQWHNDHPTYDNAALLGMLNISAALAPWGYHNLRCDWSASTCPEASSPPQGSMETTMLSMVEPWNARAVSDRALPHALAVLFGGNDYASGYESSNVLLHRTDAVRSQCCAQFVVSRDSIHQHSREEYVAIRQWLLDGSKGAAESSAQAAPQNDRVAGRILSYVWHILFTKQHDVYLTDGADSPEAGFNLKQMNDQSCPSAQDCYCRLYGRCDLEGCTSPEACLGQYRLPSNYKLPSDWAATHA